MQSLAPPAPGPAPAITVTREAANGTWRIQPSVAPARIAHTQPDVIPRPRTSTPNAFQTDLTAAVAEPREGRHLRHVEPTPRPPVTRDNAPTQAQLQLRRLRSPHFRGR